MNYFGKLSKYSHEGQEESYGKLNNKCENKMIQLTLSEWISIDDRLPKVAEDVIVFSDDKYQIDIGFLMNGKWFSDRGELHTVTHWMPLPNPPSEVV